MHLTSRHMLDETVRHSLSSNQFLSKHCVRFYMIDVTEQLLSLRTDKPLEYISNYFKSVKAGTHVLNRNFIYINGTPRNRYAFSSLVDHTYSNMDPEEKLSADEFYQLILLLCEDFPESLAQIVYRILFFGEDAVKKQENGQQQNVDLNGDMSASSGSNGGMTTGSRPTFGSLKKAFRIYFFFREFFNEILNLVFEHDTNGSLVSIERLQKQLKKCCVLNLQSHLQAQYNGNDKREMELKHMTPCYPSFEYFERILKGFDSNMKVSFNQFCKIIFDDMTDPYRDVIRCMDLRCTPFTPRVAFETHQCMNEQLSKVLYFNENAPQAANSRDNNLQIVSSEQRSGSGRSRSSSTSSRSESDSVSEKRSKRRKK